MPQYRVTGPDGRQYDVTAPDGATEQEIIARVQQQVTQAPAPTSAPQQQPPEPQRRSPVQDLTSLGTRGATGGLSDYIAAAGIMAGDAIADQLGRVGVPIRPRTTDGTFDAALRTVRADVKEAQRSRPVAATSAEITGAVTSPLFRGLAAATGRLVPGVGNLARYIRYGVQGGSVSGAMAAGYAEGEGGGIPTIVDVSERAIPAAGLGFGFGVAVPGAIEGIGAGGRMVANKVRGFAPSQQADVAAQRISQPGILGDTARTEARMRQLGPQGMLVDVGPNARATGAVVAQSPGPGAEMAERAVMSRALGRQGRLTEAVGRNISGRPFYDFIDDLAAQRSREAGPLYEQAFASNVPVQSERISSILSRPVAQTGLKRGIEIIQNEAAARGTQARLADYGVSGFNAAGDPIISGTPTLRMLHAAKIGLDDIVFRGDSGARNPTTNKLTQYGRSVDELRRALVDDLVKYTGGEQGAYAQANKLWSGPSQALDALEAGRDFARIDKEQISRMFAKFSEGEKEAYRAGAARYLQDVIEKNPNGAVTQITKPFVREKLKAILPRDQYNDIYRTALREAIFKKTEQSVLGNSETFRRAAAAANLAETAGESAMSPFMYGSTPGAFWALTRELVKTSKSLPEGVGRELASILFAREPAQRAAALSIIQTAKQSNLSEKAAEQLILGYLPILSGAAGAATVAGM